MTTIIKVWDTLLIPSSEMVYFIKSCLLKGSWELVSGTRDVGGFLLETTVVSLAEGGGTTIRF